MGTNDKRRKSPLYYFTLSVVLSLLAAAAISQGQEQPTVTLTDAAEESLAD